MNVHVISCLCVALKQTNKTKTKSYLFINYYNIIAINIV